MNRSIKNVLYCFSIMGLMVFMLTACCPTSMKSACFKKDVCPQKAVCSKKNVCPKKVSCPKKATCPKATAKVACQKDLDLQGKVVVQDKGDVKLHTYVSPPKGGFVTSHIIEGKDKLVIVDAQFLAPFAKEVRAYADSLGKPIDRIIITHGHPDHFLGLGAAFEGIPAYTTLKTKKFLSKAGAKMLQNKRKKMGDLIAEKFILPSNVIKPGTEKIDGVLYEFTMVADGEASEQLLIKLPEQNTIITQDLTFNDIHLFLGNNTFNEWITTLEELDMLTGFNTVLAGHGEPSDKSIFKENIIYLKAASDIYANVNNGKELKAKLIERFPDRRGAFILDISNKFLYK